MTNKTRRNDSQATRDFWTRINLEDRIADAKGNGLTTIPCGWCDKLVVVSDDHGQVIYCSEAHERLNVYVPEAAGNL